MKVHPRGKLRSIAAPFGMTAPAPNKVIRVGAERGSTIQRETPIDNGAKNRD